MVLLAKNNICLLDYPRCTKNGKSQHKTHGWMNVKLQSHPIRTGCCQRHTPSHLVGVTSQTSNYTPEGLCQAVPC
eukprot:s824_g5.t4